MATGPLRGIVRFYLDGFRSMTVGRTLWLIVAVKLVLIFGVLKLFFFRDPLAGRTTEERGTAVLERLTEKHETLSTR